MILEPAILVAGARADLISGIREVLVSAGYAVCTAASRDRALSLAAARPAELVLLDNGVSAVSAFEACRQLAALKRMPHAVVVLMTADGDAGELVEGFRLGHVDYIGGSPQPLALVTPFRTHHHGVRSSSPLAEPADALRRANQRLQNETSERCRMEAELRRSLGRAEASERAQAELLARLNAAQQVAGIGSWDWDLVSGTSWWSEQTYRIFGASPDQEVPGFAGGERYIHPDDRAIYREAGERALRTGEPADYDVRVCAGDGEVKWCHVQGKRVLSDAGKPVRLMGTIQDISERKRQEEAHEALEARLIQSQKMELVGRLAGGIAHDFNNLLTVIMGNAEVLLEAGAGALGSLPRDSLLEIQSAGCRARSLTQQLLAFSRRQVLELSRIDLNAVVSDFRQVLARIIGEDITLVTSLGDEPIEIDADRSQIEQIVLNLAVNARDAMRQGGVLTLTCKRTQHAACVPVGGGSVPPPGEYAELVATDTGCGISPDVVSHIFEPFFSTKELGQGTGLGLATVYGIVKQHGGYIEVESSEGAGACFRVLLPLAPVAPLNLQPSRVVAEAVRGGGERILVVEDDMGVRKLAVRMLVASGYSVLEADGMEGAVAAAAGSAPFDLLLTDVIMPRHSGREVYQALAKMQPTLKVLYMSGYFDNAIAERGVPPAGTCLLRKPFSGRQLSRKVCEALRG